jgi:argininosuccinate synthase
MKIVLAYSGGLDTSVILKWLKETYRAEVIAFSADLGQEEDWSAIEKKALQTGASKFVVKNLKEEFVREYVFPAFRANAAYEQLYLLGTSLARPIIAKHQVMIAEAEGAGAVSHGATGKGNDQVRFELTCMALNPGLKIIAPWREWNLNSRSALIDYARNHGIPVPVTPERPYSSDANLLHISYEGGILEDPWIEPPEDMYQITDSPQKAPDIPEYVEITFERGDPIAVNGQIMKPAELLSCLNRLGGKHGIGRVDLVENRYVGMKSRGVYETPGGTLIRAAHQAIESLTLDREVLHIRDSLIPRYAEMIYYGYWFSPERVLLQKLMDETQTSVSGIARLKVYKGNVILAGRKSNQSLYRMDFATFEEDQVYHQKDAEGFIRLNGLRLKIQNLVRKHNF